MGSGVLIRSLMAADLIAQPSATWSTSMMRQVRSRFSWLFRVGG